MQKSNKSGAKIINFVEALKEDIPTKKAYSIIEAFDLELQLELKDLCLFFEDGFAKKISIFISGSSIFCLRANDFTDLKTTSDIDIWIVINISSDIKDSKLAPYVEKLRSGFDLIEFPFPSQYRFSIKLCDELAIKKILDGTQNFLKVYRTNSLVKKKPRNIFHSATKEYQVDIEEQTLEDGGYLWNWNGNPVVKNDYVLTDLHSFILIGLFLEDGLKLGILRRDFIESWIKNYLTHALKSERGDDMRLFSYFKLSLPEAYKKQTLLN